MDPLSPVLVVAGVLRKEDSVLLTQRHKDSHLGGRWEFPGGKVETNESPEQALIREWREELGVTLESMQPWTFAHHAYPEKTVLLLFYRVNCLQEPVPQEGQSMRWVPISELEKLALPEADQDLVRAICSEL